MLENLLRETKLAIQASGRSIEDVVFIGSEISGNSCSWKRFTELANVEYDNGYGSAQVASDLKIVFSDGSWLERAEYDGSEWWELRKPFKQPASLKPLRGVLISEPCYSNATLADISKKG